jgi:Mn2+/Fe2+ NRAMP family transporter
MLVPVSILSQVLNGVLLPAILIYMLLLINNRNLMGKFVNSRAFNAIAWTLAVLIIFLSAIYTYMGLFIQSG